jgi:Zn-dependent M28 family amino/carboxypeptidase
VTDGPVWAHNTVAELPGERSDAIVFAGAHLDSWDLGSGTTDNGCGSMVVLEAARILAALGQRPKRTIRFLLFAGEEQGLVGSREYVKAHRSRMDRFHGGLVMDIGTAKLVGLSLHGQEHLVPLLESWFAPVRDLGLVDFNLRRQGGTDHLSFQPAGVPAFAFIHAESEYNLTHHTQSDTYDKALADDLRQAACVMATGLWAMANHEGLIPRFRQDDERR